MQKICPKCAMIDNVKAGLSKDKKQRYKCRACGCHFTRSTPKGHPLQIKRRAIQLYLEGLSFRAIGRILNVSNVTILNWVKTIENDLRELLPNYNTTVDMIILQDLQQFISLIQKFEEPSLFMTVTNSQSTKLTLFYARKTKSIT